MINPAHFDLQSLRVFLLAAESGSLTRAAEHAGMTLSALSKRIAELERTTDCALFIRLPRGLTSAGVGLLAHVRSNRMAVDVGDYAVGVRGHVKVSANTSAVVQFLPRDLADFVGQNPQLRRISDAALRAGKGLNVRIQVSSFDGICRMIEAGLGIGVLPKAAVRTELLGAGMHAISLTDEWAQRTLYLGVKSVTGLQPEALRLFEYLRGAGGVRVNTQVNPGPKSGALKIDHGR